MKISGKSSKGAVGQEKNFYNCHVHTFTYKNTPLLFPALFLLDSETGNFNIRSIPIIILVVSLICLVVLLAGPLLQIALIQINQLGQIPLSHILQSFFTYLKQPPSITFLPETPYPAWIDRLLLWTKDSLIILIIMIVLQFIMKRLINTVKWFWAIIRSHDPRRQAIIKVAYLRRNVAKTGRSKILSLLTHLNPAPNDVFERYARFLNTALLGSQSNVFREIQDQYPLGTKFIVLPMNMEHLGWPVGRVCKKIDNQHAELRRLTKKINGKRDEEEKIIYPFFTVHPEQKNLRRVIRKMDEGRIFSPDRFRGLKIYPNLGYYPNDERLSKIYEICQKANVPVMSHCTPRGIWKFGLSEKDRREFGDPDNYKTILTTYPDLRLCLAHFGGAVEWIKHLKGRSRTDEDREATWLRKIYDMMIDQDEKYPNLYTDISYTAFTPKVLGLYIDLVDYLKVLLSNPRVRKRVLFGSDYYMVEQEKISEKELSILLRSRLGEELYTQIAYTNPREFLGIAT